ncbi:hypothetical protein [Zhongshania arctica]|uniref:Uncharacterized protein n=1 Tax=Zhongshania arctica TaxID=3238302 RepID=A0ABV3TYW4_9GAMM
MSTVTSAEMIKTMCKYIIKYAGFLMILLTTACGGSSGSDGKQGTANGSSVQEGNAYTAEWFYLLVSLIKTYARFASKANLRS